MLLKDWLVSQQISPLDFGRKLGLKEPNSIYKWLQGVRIPRKEFLLKINRLTEGEVTYMDFANTKYKPKTRKAS